MRASSVESLPTDAERRNALRRLVAEVLDAARARVARIVVYGSVARGEAGDESDVDVLVLWNGKAHDGLRTLSPITTGILLDTGVDISLHVMPVEHFEELKRLSTSFYANLEQDGLVVA